MESSEEIYQEINELKRQYESLIQRFDNLEKENAQKENDFSDVSSTLKELMAKIDSIIEKNETNTMFNDEKRNVSFPNMITTPMRKATVGTIRAFLSMTDFASEKVAHAREGLEDIVAEAQYENQRKKSRMITNAQS